MLESVETLNNRLLDNFGKFNDQPKWRVVFSDDMFEKRLSWYSDEGFQLLTPRMVELPKYKQWINGKYILEKLCVVPDGQKHELTTILSYEPIWVFEDRNGNPLPPKWEAINLIVKNTENNLYANHTYAKYHDPEASPDEAAELKEQRVKALEEALFGNESDVTDALSRKEGIVVPNASFKSNSEAIH